MKDFQNFWDCIDWNMVEKDMLQFFDEDEMHTPSMGNQNLAILMQCMAVLKQYHNWLNPN